MSTSARPVTGFILYAYVIYGLFLLYGKITTSSLPTDVTFGNQDESPIMFEIKMAGATRAVNSFIVAEVLKVNSHFVDCLSCKRLV